ncbi:methylenetetrahydrofolate reductase [NAD(P)H] [bacterium]|nr:methylenetetrahydrofolate reductase [NAD(P)H] [bacterium]
MYQKQDWEISFEVFPPKTEKGLESLFHTAGQLAQHNPCFISGTYGAGGAVQDKGRDKTLCMLDTIRSRFNVPVTAHFTCVGNTVEAIRAWLHQATLLGIENIMALRGDPPQGHTEFVPTPGGLRYASELVGLIRREFPHFGIGVAGYPESHRESPSRESDLLTLKHKVDQGADAIYTQLFFDNDDFLRFRDRATALGIQVPIIPGILPVLSLSQVQRITALCASKLTDRLWERLKSHEGDADAQIQVGIDYAAEQSRALLKEGVPGVHYYVLNRSDTIRRILETL